VEKLQYNKWSVQSGAFRRPSLVVMATTPSALASTEETDNELDINVKAKVQALIPDSSRHYNLEEIDFKLAVELTRDMQLLVHGVTKPLWLDEEIADESLSEPLDKEIGKEGRTLSILRLGELADGKEFLKCLEFPKGSKVVYFRDFYEKLYQVMLKHWSSYQRALVLTGTSGTGKSWFQAYALRRLAQEDSTYKFVVRQVEGTYFLHDLTTLNVYQMKYDYNDDIALENVVNGMIETIYFYEPGRDKVGSPVYYTIPSLSTLSPNPV
jgi:hypothetical protein